MRRHSQNIADRFKEDRLTMDCGEMMRIEDWESLLEDDGDFAA